MERTLWNNAQHLDFIYLVIGFTEAKWLHLNFTLILTVNPIHRTGHCAVKEWTHSTVSAQVPASLLPNQLPAIVPGKGSLWQSWCSKPCHLCGWPSCSSGLQLQLVPGVVPIWGVSQRMDVLSLSPSHNILALCLSNKSF